MTKAQATRIVNRLRSKGIEVEMLEDYRGLGMFGQTVVAIIAHDRFSASEAEKACPALRTARVDQLGYGRVWY